MKQDSDKQDPEKPNRSLGLSPAQVAGSALASMSGAFFVSWAGTAGTLIGAAIFSVVATVGAATYTWSLRRTSEAARRTASLVRERALVTGALPRSSLARGPLREDGNDRSGAPDEPGMPPSPVEEPAEIATGKGRWDLPWVKVALASLAVMIVGMAGVTVVEAVTGKPLSAFFGKDDGTGTTVGHIVGGGSKSSTDENQAPTKNNRSPRQPEPSSGPSEQPQPQQQAPSTAPSTAPSQEPSTPAGTQLPDTGTGQ